MGKSEQCVAEKTNGAVQGVARRTETGQAQHDRRGEDSRSGVPSGTLRRVIWIGDGAQGKGRGTARA